MRLALRVSPRARREGVEGSAADADGRPVLLVRLAAPPVEGSANAALIAYLAAALSVRKADVTIRSGEKSRRKIVEIEGDAQALGQRLSQLAGLAPGR